jgi:murein DD-endopeptidase MepM/ murein hydrolase activator NlpD
MGGKSIFILFVFLFCLLGWALQMPVCGGKVSAPYGPGHRGTDIAVPPGTLVRSVSRGKIKETGFTKTRGNYIIVSHFLGESKYLHLNAVHVHPGEEITKSTVIGRSGNTGRSTGPHVHLEIWFLGIPLPAYTLCLPGAIWGNELVSKLQFWNRLKYKKIYRF